MKKYLILPFLFVTMLSLNTQAQTKESAIVYVLGNHNKDKFKISLYINNETIRKDTKYIEGDEFLELNKVLNVLLSKGWKTVSASECVFDGYYYRTVYLERDKG